MTFNVKSVLNNLFACKQFAPYKPLITLALDVNESDYFDWNNDVSSDDDSSSVDANDLLDTVH